MGPMDTELKKISTYESSFIEAEREEFMKGLESLSSKDRLLVELRFAEFLNRKVLHVAAEGTVPAIELLKAPMHGHIKRACDNIGYHIGMKTEEIGFIHASQNSDGSLGISAAVSVYRPNFNQFKQYKYSDDPFHTNHKGNSGIIKPEA